MKSKGNCMETEQELASLLASLRGYLEDLRECGMDGVPLLSTSSSVTPPAARQRETLEEIRAELGECRRCSLGQGRMHLVYGAGPEHARLVFVGEVPGSDEDLGGEPFVGEAGPLLMKIIQAMGFGRDEVYICNVLKCRPPDDRSPHHEEIEACRPFLERQIAAIGPEVVVALGTVAAQVLLQTKEPISVLRGRFRDFHGIPLMPTFHPAFLLKNPERKREVWEDMQQVMKLLGKLRPGR